VSRDKEGVISPLSAEKDPFPSGKRGGISQREKGKKIRSTKEDEKVSRKGRENFHANESSSRRKAEILGERGRLGAENSQKEARGESCNLPRVPQTVAAHHRRKIILASRGCKKKKAVQSNPRGEGNYQVSRPKGGGGVSREGTRNSQNVSLRKKKS